MSKCSTIIGEDRVGELIEKISELQRAHLAATGEARAAQRPAKPAAGGDGTEELLAAMNRKAGSSAGDSAPRGHASEESASAGERDPRKRPASASRRGPREGRPKDGGGARGASGDGGGKEGESDSEGAAGPAAGAGLDEVDAATAEEARAAAAELEADRARAAAAQENLRRAEALAEETKRGLAEAERVAASEQRERALRMREHEAQARVRDVESVSRRRLPGCLAAWLPGCLAAWLAAWRLPSLAGSMPWQRCGKQVQEQGAALATTAEATATAGGLRTRSYQLPPCPPPPPPPPLPPQYLELLYEEDPKQRQEGASLILALARHADTLPALLDHGTLLGALSRVLREDYKKSGELAGTIVQVFYCISRLSDQQGVVADQRVGDVTIRIIELETKRHAARLKVRELVAFSALHRLQRRSLWPFQGNSNSQTRASCQRWTIRRHGRAATLRSTRHLQPTQPLPCRRHAALAGLGANRGAGQGAGERKRQRGGGVPRARREAAGSGKRGRGLRRRRGRRRRRRWCRFWRREGSCRSHWSLDCQGAPKRQGEGCEGCKSR